MDTSPAPWFVTTRSIPSGQALRIIDHNGGQVANVQRGNQLGNGYLIAAAPELLEYCERLLGFAYAHGDMTALSAGAGMLDGAKAVIERARGE